MKLTPFGLKAKNLRTKYGIQAKDMAGAMGMSPSHLSGLECGDKNLNIRHIEAFSRFLVGKVTPAEIRELRLAAAQSVSQWDASFLPADLRNDLSRFMFQIQRGAEIPLHVRTWLSSTAEAA